MGNLSRNFSSREFECRCGCGFSWVSEELIERLQSMRDDYGAAITITSGARCPEHNAKVGGSPDSEHLPRNGDGPAEGADIAYSGSMEYHLLDITAHLNFRRIGQADNFIHVGCRESKAQDVTWRYPPKKEKE